MKGESKKKAHMQADGRSDWLPSFLPFDFTFLSPFRVELFGIVASSPQSSRVHPDDQEDDKEGKDQARRQSPARQWRMI